MSAAKIVSASTDPEQNTCYVLDTSALIALRADEPGAAFVVDLLGRAQQGAARCLVCFMSLMEVFYCVWRIEGELEGETAYRLCLSLPVEIIRESPELLAGAARMKAENCLSLADSWIAAAARITDATLVHKDPEFSALPLKQEALPLKSPTR